jgi:hypothetical protein
MNQLRILTLILFLLSFVIAGCSNNDVVHNETFENALFSLVENQQNKEIEIHSIADFKWDKAYLFQPYTTQANIEKKLGVEYKDPSNINSSDDIYLLVFLNEGKVVQYAEINRRRGEFSTGGKEYLSPSEDVLKIERE